MHSVNNRYLWDKITGVDVFGWYIESTPVTCLRTAQLAVNHSAVKLWVELVS